MSDVLAQPLSSTEFLVVDTETNGKAGDDCELTEIGAVLVGGGELHDRWETLVRVRAPLSRMIQRFTGISQAMVDEAPAVELVLPDLAEQLDGQRARGHNVAFDRRVLRQAFARAELEWPDPPTLCTVALARRFAPLARRRGLSRSPRRSASRSRSRTARWPTPRRARACCARCCRGSSCTPARSATRSSCCGRGAQARARPRAGRTHRRARAARSTASTSPGCPTSPASTCSATPAARSLYIGKSVSLRTRARSHFQPARRRRAGSRRRRWSTTARRPPSSARSCSSTGSSRSCARRATCA